MTRNRLTIGHLAADFHMRATALLTTGVVARQQSRAVPRHSHILPDHRTNACAKRVVYGLVGMVSDVLGAATVWAANKPSVS